MKRDLWLELAARARKETQAPAVAPFGFEREVLKRAGRSETSFYTSVWLPMMRPALVLAFGVMGICLAIQFSMSPGPLEADLLSETDALMITALFQ